jgi:hypothetical protein
MLVDMGDLPQPDNNVLSEILWNSENSVAGPHPAGTIASSLANRNSINGKKLLGLGLGLGLELNKMNYYIFLCC